MSDNISWPDSKIQPVENNYIIKIIGFGNILMGDDGIGIRVIEELNRKQFFKNHDNIELIDGGTSGIDLVFILQQADRAVIVDAIDAGQDIGQIVVFTPDEIKEIKKKNKGLKSFSIHDIDLLEVLELLKTINVPVKIIMVGIKPKNISYGDKLSPEIENKIPELISIVKEAVFAV